MAISIPEQKRNRQSQLRATAAEEELIKVAADRQGQTASAQTIPRAPRRETPVVRALAKPEYVIDKLRREHEPGTFDCANATLNDWLRKFAWTYQQADSAKTYVALDGNRAIGSYALTTGSVHKHERPQRIAKGLVNHPIGVVLLAGLAVDRAQQGKALGKALLFDALSGVEEAADIAGVRAVLVHAIDDAARRFYLHLEFEESLVDPYQLLLLLKDLRKAIHL